VSNPKKGLSELRGKGGCGEQKERKKGGSNPLKSLLAADPTTEEKDQKWEVLLRGGGRRNKRNRRRENRNVRIRRVQPIILDSLREEKGGGGRGSQLHKGNRGAL